MSDCHRDLLRKSNVPAPQDKTLLITERARQNIASSDFMWYETKFYKYLVDTIKTVKGYQGWKVR